MLACAAAPVAIAAEPAEAIHRRAVDDARAGRTAPAIEALRPLAAQQSAHQDILGDYAVILGWAGDHAAALALLPRVDRSAAPPYVLEGLAGSARRMKQPGLAESLYIEAIARAPDRVEPGIGLALTLADSGAFNAAAALIDGTGAVAARRRIIDGLPLRYAYDLGFAPQVGRFVVAGSSGAGGFVSLVSLTGEVVTTRQGLPPMASESRIVLGWDGTRLTGVYPVRPRGIAVVRIGADTVELVKLVDHPYEWDYTGTTGVFTSPGRLLFATLSKEGIKLGRVELGDLR